MGLNTEPHAFCTLAQSTVSTSPWSFPFFSSFFFLSCSLFCLSLLIPYYSDSLAQSFLGLTSRIYPNKQWLSGYYWKMQNNQTQPTHSYHFKKKSLHFICIHCVFVICMKAYTHRDNLSTDTNGLISGKWQILSICRGTHMQTNTHTQRKKKDLCYSFLVFA